jgi:Flp pilus assembly protein TadD
MRLLSGTLAPLALALPALLGVPGLAGAQEASPPAGVPAEVRVRPTGGLGMEAAALLLSGQQGGTVPVAVAATPIAATGGGTVDVLVVVEVAGAGLVAQAGPSLRLEVCLYALASPGAAVEAALLETIEVDLATLRSSLATGGIRWVRHLALSPGEHSLRVLVREPTSGEVGLRAVPLAVPGSAPGSAAEPALPLAPSFAGAATSWLTVAGVGGAPAPAFDPPAPAALPVLALERPASLSLLVPAALAAERLSVQVRSLGAGSWVDLPAQVVSRAPAELSGLDRLVLAFPLGPQMPPGEHELRVAAPGDVVSPTARVILAAAAEGTTWAVLAGTAPPREAPAAAALPGPGPRVRHREAPRHLVATYRAALGGFSSGDLTGDRAPLPSVRAFEAPLLRGGSVSPAELAEVELAVLRRLAAVDRAALLPILWHYLEVYREAAAAQAGGLSSHAREMVFALAALYAEAGSPAEAKVAAAAMVAFVEAIPPAGSRWLVGRALRQAISIADDDPDVLRCAAIDAERGGQPALALERLATLRKLEPHDLEARLRFAVDLARTGDRRQARRQLAALLEAAAASRTTPPPWWLSVAYEELARLALEARDLQTAERVLRAGLLRLPRDEKLSLQLALVLARRGARPLARDLLAALRPGEGGEAASARHRYSQLPAAVLARARADLRERAGAARTALVAALAKTAAEPTR